MNLRTRERASDTLPLERVGIYRAFGLNNMAIALKSAIFSIVVNRACVGLLCEVPLVFRLEL